MASGSFDDRRAQANRDAVKAFAIAERGLDDVMALLKFATADRGELDRVVVHLWDDPQVRKEMEEAETDRDRERQADAARKDAFARAQAKRQEELARSMAEASMRKAPEPHKVLPEPREPMMPSAHSDRYESPEHEAGEAEEQHPAKAMSPSHRAAIKQASSRGR